MAEGKEGVLDRHPSAPRVPRLAAKDEAHVGLLSGCPAPRPAPLRLVPAPHPRGAGTRSLLTRWHLLSLDAPSVAAVWTVFVARCAGVTLSWVDPLAMFLAVWMLYAADRLLDARPLAAGLPPPDLEERHWFHHRHRVGFERCLVAAALPLAYLLHRLLPAALHLYAVLAALLAGWLLVVHAQPPSPARARRLPKELAVGLFFPAAVFIPAVARAPALRLALLPGAALFAGACTLNCLLLYAWEHPGDRTHAHVSTRYFLRALVPFASVLVLFAVSWILFSMGSRGGVDHPVLRQLTPLPAACAFSIALLLGLHRVRPRLSSLRLRALADAALLTPLFFLLKFAANHHR